MNLLGNTINTDCTNLVDVVKYADPAILWRYYRAIHSFLETRAISAGLMVEAIPGDDNYLADGLAAHECECHELAVFHRGLDLPQWIMEQSRLAGFTF